MQRKYADTRCSQQYRQALNGTKTWCRLDMSNMSDIRSVDFASTKKIEHKAATASELQCGRVKSLAHMHENMTARVPSHTRN